MVRDFDTALIGLPDKIVASISSVLPHTRWLDIELALAAQSEPMLSLPERLEWYDRSFNLSYKKSKGFAEEALRRMFPARTPLLPRSSEPCYWEYVDTPASELDQGVTSGTQTAIQLLLVPRIAKAILAVCSPLPEVNATQLNKLRAILHPLPKGESSGIA